MNILDIPRSLVYKDIENLDDFFGRTTEKTVEREFYEMLRKLPFIEKSEKTLQSILLVFNSARFIYYLIMTEDNSPSLNFNTYLAKAAQEVEDKELKSHIIAAVMALVYNWLDYLLRNNKSYIQELQNNMYKYFDEDKEKYVNELKDKIFCYFSRESEITSEDKSIFFGLLMNNSSMPIMIEKLFEDVISDIEEISASAPIQDVAQGIDYIMDCYDSQYGTDSERYLFYNIILKRFEKEKNAEKYKEVIECAKEKINREIYKLESATKSKDTSHDFHLDMIPDIIKDDEHEIDPEIGDQIGWIKCSSKAPAIIKTLRDNMAGKKFPRDVLMPLSAAYAESLIRKPTWKEYKRVFPDFPLKSESSLNEWISINGVKTYKKQERYKKEFDSLCKIFKDIQER